MSQENFRNKLKIMSFTDKIIEAVWNKGHIIFDFEGNVWRKDDKGAIMKREEYGNRNSSHGWEIDHIVPLLSGGSDDLENLRPLQWQNNVARNG